MNFLDFLIIMMHQLFGLIVGNVPVVQKYRLDYHIPIDPIIGVGGFTLF